MDLFFTSVQIFFGLFWYMICTEALNNGLALTPPMGWMSWQRYRCNIDCKTYPNDCLSERLIKRIADLMVSEGYKDIGYEYVIIDDCWFSKQRDPNGRLLPDPDRFPNGMKAVGDYIHGKGLKFGIYEDYGNFTCAGYPGLFGHLEEDAETFAEWGVDYLKVDTCYSYTELDRIEEGYEYFGQLLNKTGRPIVYSCSWPAYFEWKGIHPNYSVLKRVCNVWRNYGDIEDSWSDILDILDWFAKNQYRIAPHAGPGHWNDPDMLILGNFGLSLDQSKSQMALWAILAAPLLISADLGDIKPNIKYILQNEDIIAINQDSLGVQGSFLRTKHNIDIWSKPILPVVDGVRSAAVAFLSRIKGGYPYRLVLNIEELGLESAEAYRITNLFSSEKVPVVLRSTDPIGITVNPSGVVLLKFVPEDLSSVDTNKRLSTAEFS